MKQKFNITGMTCAACSAHVEKAASKVPGVSEASVNLLGGTMTAELSSPEEVQAVISAVEAAGYGASVPAVGAARTAPPPVSPAGEELKEMKRRFIVSLCFLLPLFYLSMGHMMGLPVPMIFHGPENALTLAFTEFLLLLPILFVNNKYYRTGFRSLFHGAPNMDTLIAVGSAAAVVYGAAAIYQIGWGLGHGDLARASKWSMDLYFEGAGMILTLITLGKMLETRSKGRTGDAIARMIDLTPKTARVLRDGDEREIPVEEVREGDLVVVKPGGAVPVDGVITEGASSLDESALTGESLPVDKGPGDAVIAATLNKSGSFVFRATRVGEDTTLAQMIRLVEEAASSKAPIAKLADRVAGVFVPVVMTIAAVTALVWLLTGHGVSQALTSAVAVLVISCPCALGLATPVAIMVGTGKGAEYGILFKSAEALETLKHVDTVVLDKTGTVTEGRPSVTDLIPFGGETETSMLTLALSLEARSEHPLARAVVDAGTARSLSPLPAERFSALHGLGVEGTVEGAFCLGGSRALLEERGVPVPPEAASRADELAGQGKTPLFFSRNGTLAGIAAVADTVRATSREAISAFQSKGIDVVLLTGDNSRTAQAVAGSLGIGRVVSQVLPADKERQIAALQREGRRVCMVGDGVNDAPALARADVGIAIGAGTDVAIESADVVLMKSDLNDAVAAVELSRATIRNIKENLFWAFFYNSIGIPLAAGVFYPLLGWQLNPMFAAAAMSLSSVCVVTNALRLRAFRPERLKHKTSTTAAGTPASTKGEPAMTKTVKIEGMMCAHCVSHVEKALSALGADPKVDLASGTAVVSAAIDNEAIKKAVADAGYTVTGIE